MVFPAKAFVFAEIHERTNERLRDAPRKSGAGRLHKKNGNALKSSAGSWTHAIINPSKAQPLALGFTSKFRGRNRCSPPMFSRKTSKSLRAFTLIELFVVVAIIVVLAALIVPAARKAMENGQKATCLGNMRALSAGLLQYTADNNNMFPGWGWAYNEPNEGYVQPADRRITPPPFAPREPGKGDARCGLLMRGGYIQNEKVFCCPARRTMKPSFYGVNGKYSGCTYSLNGTPAVSLSSVLRKTDGNLDFPIFALRTPPSGTVMLVEESDSNGLSYDNGISGFHYLDPRSAPDTLGTTFHANVGNVVFFDGSARSMTAKEWRANAFEGGIKKARQFFGGLWNERW
jgi:prepilin-type processing-associated H-X9-DG protein